MAEFIQNLCHWKNTLTPTDCVSIFLAIVTLIATIYIPHKIKWEQRYTSLLDSYRSLEFAAAYQAVIEFFATECKGDMSLVKEKYREHFVSEITNRAGNIDKDNTLHFHRRLLAQFFWQLNECAKSPSIGKRRVVRDFTKSEASLLKILIWTGGAIDGDDILYKDISSHERVKRPERLKGQNRALGEIYRILKESGRFMG